MKRDNEGRIILDNFYKQDKYIEGRKDKIWLSDGKDLYLFKTGAINYEVYAELISSELAKQAGLEAATYDLAIYKGETGVVTKSFLKKGDLIVSGADILKDGEKLAKINNIDIPMGYNALDCIISSLNLRYSFINIEEIVTSLIKLWCFDILISESDRNSTNWGIISNREGIKIAPVYDSSTMAFLNNDISTYMNRMYSYDTLIRLLDAIKISMSYKKELENKSILEQFSMLCQENLVFVENIMDSLLQIDVDLAIKNIEERHNSNKSGDKIFEIPPAIGIWISKIIEFRKKDLLGIMNHEKSKIEKQKR